ncbi:response regulator transcription factor [Meridianimaribacter flavus]|uniref:DNA-binding NarL/FixJ family response regulator n=1 Tax=Meridianimaribacter flavus TaxID=571115 RepID=A0ABY2G7K1_9FLAO|nr:response regulator transcription factor [Meridianimaribacter flavus]TDY11945.1 DNA-binding NarL/FixJ family response regulator [Meridianimaribacter flavus]
MFQKVLINDDHDAILSSITQILKSAGVNVIERAQYCDEAYLKLKKAQLETAEFDLLITDLSFKRDHRNANLENGEDLIQKVREDFPNMSIIVYSMKDQLQKVRLLVNQYGVNGYVCKDRNGSKELYEAIKSVALGQVFLSPQVDRALHPNANMEIDEFDIQLINLLSKGWSQDDISEDLKTKNISPNSLSTIEKRLNKLKVQFKANNTIHLVAITKDLGLI